MNDLREIPDEEFIRQTHRENTYIVLSVISVLSEALNLSQNSKDVCQYAIRTLYDELGTDDIIIHME